MKKYNKINLILLAIVAMALFATACEDTKKIEEANKFVDSANKKMDEAKALIGKAADSFEKISKDMTDLAETRKAHESELKEIIKSYDKILELQKSSAGDFVAASKANSNEKFKAYYETSAKDMENTAEMVSQNKEMVQAFIDSKDIDAYSKKIDTISAKIDSLKKESDELREKLKKLEQEVNALNK